MDTLTLVLEAEHIVVTFTSDGPLSIPAWVETTVPDYEHVSWLSLAVTGVLDLDPLPDAGAAAFGLNASADFGQTYAHISLVDDTLNLWAVSKSESTDLLGWVVLSEN